MDKKAYIMSRQYTDESIQGTSGVLAGKNAQISSIEHLEDDEGTFTRITFSWYKDGETEARFDSIDVRDGEKGTKGEQGEQGVPGESAEIYPIEAGYNRYFLHVKSALGEFNTPNLKGMGSPGVDVSVDDEEQNLIFNY